MSSYSSIIFAIFISILALTSKIWPGHNSVEAIPINQLRAAYPPISDEWLRTLLGLEDDDEQQQPTRRGLLLIHQPMNVLGDGEVSNSQTGSAHIFVAKRKNAELVNHILKNFASLNRLGDAGK